MALISLTDRQSADVHRQSLETNKLIAYELFKIGLHDKDIAPVLGVGVNSVQHNRKALKANVFPKARHSEAYKKAFFMYLDLTSAPIKPEIKAQFKHLDDGVMRELVQALERYIGGDTLKSVAKGIFAVIYRLCCPDDPSEYKKYRLLLTALFGYPTKNFAKISDDIFLREIGYALKGSDFDRESFSDVFASTAIRLYEIQFTLPLDHKICYAFEKAMANLSEQKKEIISMRFGLCSKIYTRKEVAKYLNIPTGRVLRLEKQALRNLRHPSRSEFLIPFVSLTDVTRRLLEEKFPE